MTDKRTYWAAEQNPQELVRRTFSRFAAAMNTARKTGTLDRTRRMLMAYYGRGVDGRDTTRTRLGGKQGELAIMTHNAVRPLNAQVLALICGQRPGLKPVATNTDDDSIAQTALADGIRAHYERTLEVPAVETDVVRGGTLAGQFWAVESWKRSKGAAYGIDEEGRLAYEGGIELVSLPWWRGCADPLARRPTQRQWFLFKSPANRFDLAAEYPKSAEKLLDGAEVREAYDWKESITGSSDFEQLDVLFGDTLEAEEGVWVWELRHLPTPALPKGRIVKFINADCVLFDSAQFIEQPPTPASLQTVDSGAEVLPVIPDVLERDEEASGEGVATGAKDVGYPYAELHAYDYCPERVVGTTVGHASSWDVLGIQEMLDVCTVTFATVVNLYGMPHLWAGPGGAAGLNANAMSTGPVILETPTKPEVLKFEAFSTDIVEGIGLLRELAAEAASLNKSVMGDMDPGMPAQLAALQRAQAVQVHQTATGEYVRLVENVATGLLKLSQRFAKSEQTAEIAGKSGAFELKKWKREDIAGVPRFAVEIVNPLTQSFEGRQAEAQFMADRVDPKTGKPWLSREGYLTLKSTGSLKEPLEADQAKLELLTQHKTLLRKGKGLPPIDMEATEEALTQWSLASEAAAAGGEPAGPAPGPVFMGGDGEQYVRLNKLDPHWYAIPEYFSVLLSPAARENPAVVKAVLGVIQESQRLWASLTPDELAIMGGPPLPSQIAASQPGIPPEAGGSAPSADVGTSAPGEPIPIAKAGPGEPELPKPPPDPINGQQQGPEAAALQ
ncbi:MAG: hypothetical protein Q8K32_11075 [Archangium sp.]|nr:hypothetical protein [Archangium sp.]